MSGVETQRLVEQLKTRLLSMQLENKNLLQLFKSATLGFLQLNDEQVIKEANMVAAWLIDCPIADLQEKKISSLIHPDDQNEFEFFLNSLSSSTSIECWTARVISYRKIDKRIGFLGIAIQTDQQKTEFLLVLENITKPTNADKRVENHNELLRLKVLNQNFELYTVNEELQKKVQQLESIKQEGEDKEAKLNAIFNAAVEGIITINESGTIQSINTAVTDILGYQAEELVGFNISKIMPSPHSELHDSYLQNYFQTGVAKIIGQVRELEGQRKNGSLVPVELSIAEYTIKNKRYFTGLLRDISVRKQKEQIEKQHLSELAHVARLGLMGELASGLAHEINQPLTAIAAYSQVNLRLIDDKMPDLKTIHETLQKIEDQALRAGKIIRRMREFISNRTQHISSVSINQLTMDAVDLCIDSCKTLNIKVQYDLTPTDPSISADLIQIEQVLINLIKNSIDAVSDMPESLLRLITIQTHVKEKQEVEIRVKDNGLGISEANQSKLFNPFYSTKENGMGMGLSICRSIIEAHHGHLRFNTKSGKGSTFYFSLPLLESTYDG